MRWPHLVVGIDWSVNENKRWMTRASLQEEGSYLVFAPEPVGDIETLLCRFRSQIPGDASALIGFDFPIGLPEAYAEVAGIHSFRAALAQFGTGPRASFYEVSANPSSRQPFYPPPTQVKGQYSRQALADGIGVPSYTSLLRRCERHTATRGAAQSVFYTLGGKQVGHGAIQGWSKVLAPALEQIGLWVFDGDLVQLSEEPRMIIAEIYPGEAYSHLGIKFGCAGASKRNRSHRLAVIAPMIESGNDSIKFSDVARSWIKEGFRGEDDFDATVGVLSMLQVVTGRRSASVPEGDALRKIEGWILGPILFT